MTDNPPQPELPPNERPRQPQPEADSTPNPQTLLWSIVGVVVLVAIAAGAIVGFIGGRVFVGVNTATDEDMLRLLGAVPVDTAAGVTLERMNSTGPAWNAGIRPTDLVLSVDGEQITSAGQVRRLIWERGSGATVTVVYERAGRPDEVQVTLGVFATPIPPTVTPRPTSTPFTPPTSPPQQGQQIESAKLGITYRAITEEDGDRFNVDGGAIVITTITNGPAFRAGLQPGDIILGVGPVDVLPEMPLAEALERFRAGDIVGLRVLRDGQEQTVEVALGG